jgi:molecular chaperone GrpE
MTDETQLPKPDEPAAAATDIPVEIDDTATKLATLEKEKKELHERLLRTAADFDNFRKRSRKDQDDARAKAREDVLREILPVADNLERALQAAETTPGGQAGTASASGIADGVKLVLRQLASALDRFEVKAFSSLGEAFDPARHEAISQVETADQPAGTVVNEMQKGYLMGSRLLRPAMVAVARPPAPPPTSTDESEGAGEDANSTGTGTGIGADAPAGEGEGS